MLAQEAALVAGDEPAVLGDLVETLLLSGESATAHGLLEHPAWQHAADAETLLR